jgi:hypothetical protein
VDSLLVAKNNDPGTRRRASATINKTTKQRAKHNKNNTRTVLQVVELGARQGVRVAPGGKEPWRSKL